MCQIQLLVSSIRVISGHPNSHVIHNLIKHKANDAFTRSVGLETGALMNVELLKGIARPHQHDQYT